MNEPIRKAIAIDFDGCLCSYAFPEIGAPHWDVISRAKKEQQMGAGLILWTCREGDLLQEAIDVSPCPCYLGRWRLGAFGAVKCKAVKDPLPGAYFDLICEKNHKTCPHRAQKKEETE